MCGLAGVLNNAFSIDADQLAGICRKVSFRGPDSSIQRLYDEQLHPGEQGNTAVFFNRLAIIDLDPRSNQPFENERYTLVFNGEIYNYRSLKDQLKALGFIFRTTSDTEVLFYALQHWDIEALRRINGMFAFCWLDRKERRFILSRDRAGIKPLYYRQHGKSLIFSSELDSVLRLSPDRPDVEPAAIHQFLQTQFIPTPFTIIHGIFKLPPGHYLAGSWDHLQQAEPLQPEAYWDAYEQAATVADPSAGADPADLEKILVDTLSRQMVADVPLGLFLSSGVDSSLLTALVNKHFAGSGDVNLFTVAFTEDTVSDESRDAAEFVKGFGNPHLHPHRLVIDPRVIGGHLDRMYDYFDEPFGDPTSLLNWVISTKAKEFVTVALSGDGADELFWGYGRYGQWRDASLTLPGNRVVNRRIGALLQPFLPGYWRSNAALQLEKDPVKRHFNLFASPVITRLEEKAVWQYPIWALCGIDRIRHREDLVSLLDVKTYLADAMLHKVDRASMAARLEVRVPYLDNTVIDYALLVPLSAKSDSQYRHKAILKRLLTRLAPHYPINRPKKGFNFPLDNWLRHHWRDKTLQLVDRDTLAALGLDPKPYLEIVRRYYSGDKNNCIPVWYLLNLALWYRKYKAIIPQQPAI